MPTNRRQNSTDESLAGNWHALDAYRDIARLPADAFTNPAARRTVDPLTCKAVCFVLCSYARNGTGGGAFPSVKRLADSCGRDRRTIQAALRQLEALGYIRQAFGAVEGTRRARTYSILIGRRTVERAAEVSEIRAEDASPRGGTDAAPAPVDNARHAARVSAMLAGIGK